MNKLASIVLNWIGGGKTPIPVRFLKSVDIPGDTPNSGNQIHILEVNDALEQTSNEELLKENLFLDGKPFEQSDISKIHIHDTVVKLNSDYYGISQLRSRENMLTVIAGYDSSQLDMASIIYISLNYTYNLFRIDFHDV